MDLFFAYMLVASATPLFLWIEYRRIALFSVPFIVVMWGLFAAFLLGATTEATFISAFLLNVFIAHVAAFLLYAYPYARKQKQHTVAHLK